MSKNRSEVVVKLKRQDGSILLPSAGTPGAAGMDVHAAAEINIGPGKWAAIPTGLSMEIPEGWEVQVRPRSGLALKYGVTVLNAPGTIDSDYRGEIKVLLINHGTQDFNVKIGDRIAQLVLGRTYQNVWTLVSASDEPLSATVRGEGGFGSTGA